MTYKRRSPDQAQLQKSIQTNAVTKCGEWQNKKQYPLSTRAEGDSSVDKQLY